MSDFPLSFLSEYNIRQNTIENTDLSEISNANTKALMELIDNIKSGDTIIGKILSVSNDSFVLSTLDDTITLNAKTDSSVTLEKGQTVLFEVKKFADSHIALRPLNANTNATDTAKRAVLEAGIPINNRTVEMTVRNMEYGNPIDKRNLLDSYKDVFLHAETPVKYIVDLQTMKIPVTEGNIEQYEAYTNMKNDMFLILGDISDELFDYLGLNELSEDTLNNPIDKDSIKAETILKFDKIVSNVDELINKLNSNADFSSSPDVASANIFEKVKEFVLEVKNNFVNRLELIGYNSEPKNEEEAHNENVKISMPDNKVFEGLAKDDSLQVTKNLKQSFRNSIFSSLDSVNVLNTADESDQKVRTLYDNLFKETRKLVKDIDNALPKDNPISSLTTTINHNMDFALELNNFIPYVQIPIKNNMGLKGAELYVFSSGKRARDNTDSLSAFIHLDMDNLGPTDVYVKLVGDVVTTDFRLADELALDLVEKNIDFLEKRINGKGYSFKFTSKISENEKSPFEEVMDKTLHKIYVAKTSFDARI